jgi:invasion protein IalB
MAPGSRLALAALLLALMAAGGALAQSPGQNGPGVAVPKGAVPKGAVPKGAAPTGPAPILKAPPAAPEAAADNAPTAKVAGSFGSWTLLCGKESEDKAEKERCSLVLPLVEKDSQKLVFRVIVTYGPQGNLVLRVDGPTGVALQRGLEFSPDTKKVYRMAYQTCLPMGCKALLLISDDLKQEIAGSKQGAITVYALNGKALQTVTDLSGFTQGLAALDKHMAGQ